VTVVALLSDWGLDDPYLAEVKAVILSGVDPPPSLVDVTHAIPPGDVVATTWVLRQAWLRFPVGTVFLVGVDADTGGDCSALVADHGGRWFVGPGNGVAAFLADSGTPAVWRLTRPPASCSIFDGRDLLAPAVAHLVRGGDPAELSTPAGVADLGRPAPTAGPSVVWIDHFGNLITDLARDSDLGRAVDHGATVWLADRCVRGPYRRYGDAPAGEPFWYWGSWQTLEVAIPGDEAAVWFQAKRGLVITVMAP